MGEKSDQGSDSDYGFQDVGGLVRNVVRSAFRTVGRTSLGSFPLPRPQTIAKSTSNFSDLLDLRDLYREAIDTHGERGGWKKYPRLISAVIPGFIKNSICGTALFAVYDILGYNRDYMHAASAAFVCGSLGGYVHGLIACSWDAAIVQWQRFQKGQTVRLLPWKGRKVLPYSFHGTLFSHTLVHGTLFWVYDTTRLLLENSVGKEMESAAADWASAHQKSFVSPEGESRSNGQIMPARLLTPVHILAKTICIVCAGAVAGVASENVGYYLEAVETSGLRQGLPAIRSMKRPTARIILPATIPSCAGFLAYEFGKYEEE